MPPKLTWTGKKGQVYFVNFASFQEPNTHLVIAGPLACQEDGEMEWRGTESVPGIYFVGTENGPVLALVRHLLPDGMMLA